LQRAVWRTAFLGTFHFEVGPARRLVRCRSRDERGLAWTPPRHPAYLLQRASRRQRASGGSGAKPAVGGVPTYPRSVLIQNRDLAAEMVSAMGDRPVAILRGHGLTAAGATAQEAVLRAIAIDSIAHMSLAVRSIWRGAREDPRS